MGVTRLTEGLNNSGVDPFQPPGFACNGCGKCCTNLSGARGVLLLPGEVLAIAGHLGRTPSDFFAEHVRLLRLDHEEGRPVAFALADRDGTCPFLTADRLCGVQAVKPAQCRLGPFGLLHPQSVEADYDCLEGLQIPADWNSQANDRDFRAAVLHPDEQAAVAQLVRAADGF